MNKYNNLPSDANSVPLGHAKQIMVQKHGKQASKTSGKPKRPLTAYNLFFKHERSKILAETPVRSKGKPRRSHGKISFASLTCNIPEKWKNLDNLSRHYFDELAAEEKARYRREKEDWKKNSTTEQTTKESSTNISRLTSFQHERLVGTLQDLKSIKDFGSIHAAYNDYSVTQYQSTPLNNSCGADIKNIKQGKGEHLFKKFSLNMKNFKFPKPMEGLFLHQNVATLSSLKDEKGLHRNDLAKNDMVSSLDIESKALAVEDEMIPCAMKCITPQNWKRQLISELAAKLDNECVDLLCGWWHDEITFSTSEYLSLLY